MISLGAPEAGNRSPGRVVTALVLCAMLFYGLLSLYSALSLTGLSLAAPTLERRTSDAPFSVSTSTMQSAITCPNGIQKKAGGVVLLVHGTGSTGSESWSGGPYDVVLPTAGKGYDICWVDLPGRSLVDAQLSAEYVAYGVQYLAPQSATKKVSIIGHSQGAGLNPQWALVFWPSIQPLVSNYIALAPDFHGTIEVILLCTKLNIPTCEPSVWQQTVGSNYLAAQNSINTGGGGKALVPTTSIYTLTDDIIQPELPPLGPTSFLTGAGVHALQDVDVCGPTHVADHFSMVVDPAAFGLALTTLEKGGPVDLADFDRSYCTYLKDDVLLNATGIPVLLNSAFQDAVAFATGGRVSAQPALQPYVCERGFAETCGTAF
ncbi:alpha/beta-hydrolase [Meredithblackwellia eburnea MCA 4105]